MHRRRRDVIPELGGNFLDSIGEANRKWHEYKCFEARHQGRLGYIKDHAQEVGQSVLSLGILDGSWVDPDILTRSLTEQDRDAIVRAYLANQAAEHFRELEQHLGEATLMRVHITIEKPAVRMLRTFTGTEMPSLELLQEGAQIRDGEEFDDVIVGLQSVPPYGGLVTFSNPLRRTHIVGLVNPPTGDPRVKMDILRS